MTAFFTMFIYAVLLVLLSVPGFIMGKLKLLQQQARLSLSNILMYVAMPFLAFSVLVETDIKSVAPIDFAVCAAFPVVLEAVLLAVASLLFRKSEKNASRVELFCSVFSNCGFMGIPLAAALFPENSAVALYVSFYNVFSSFMLWTVGIFVLSGDRSKISIKKAVLNPITCAIVFGILLSLVCDEAVLSYIHTYASKPASLTAPLSMIYLGFELSEISPKRIFLQKSVYAVGAVKLILSPLLGIGIILLLRLLQVPASESCFVAAFIGCSVSTAATASPLSDKYGLDGEYAAALTLGNTLLSIASLPIMYMLLLNLI